MNRDDPGPTPSSVKDAETEAALLERLRDGDVEAGRRFVRDHYLGIYRYLLSLTERRELAEDLTQQTFLQAWRHLDTFQGRAPLRHWLYRIARREFLHALRAQRTPLSLEEIGELLPAGGRAAIEGLELRDAIDRLPLAEREVMLLHYLEGYSSSEIAPIVRASAGTVRYRLMTARERLRQELGEGDLSYLNEPLAPMRQWNWLPLDQVYALETRLPLGGVGGWGLGVGTERRTPNAQSTRCAGTRTPNARSEATKEDEMERREFLRHAAVGAAAMMLPEAEKEVVDSRLTQKVTCAFKGTALSDLCERLKTDSGIQLSAGPSVADEKVTLFCEKLPLREVMRQLSRPFGYTWLRTRKVSGVRSEVLGGSAAAPNTQHLTPNTEYRYELVQDLRSQLLEEELRNRDRNAALLALEQEIERYRRYLDLSPEEALARSKTAAPAEKPLLEKLGGKGWGLIQLYFRLSPPELAQLRSGQPLRFSEGPRPGEQPLPAEVARGVLQSLRDVRLERFDDGFKGHGGVTDGPGIPPTDVPEARAAVLLELKQSELGQFVLDGGCGVFTVGPFLRNASLLMSDGALASGTSPVVLKPDNERDNARLAHAPAMQRQVTVETGVRGQGSGVSLSGPPLTPGPRPLTPGAKRLTTADVLEAIHHATGWPVVADFYTRLYPAEQVSVHDQPLFAALNHLTDTMRLRWHQDTDWLQFRSASFYDDRLKEVPNRLLTRWSEARRRQGFLTLDDLCEISQLSDAQLDAEAMAEGAKEIWGLAEWDLVRTPFRRPHLRYLAGFSPEQRQEAQSDQGLPFDRMSLAQQQGFITRGLGGPNEPLQSMEELAGAALRVEYTHPDQFEWPVPGAGYLQWVVPVEPGPQGRRVLMPLIRARSREETTAAIARMSAPLREALVREERRLDPQFDETRLTPQQAQIRRAALEIRILYFPGVLNRRHIHVIASEGDFFQSTW